MIYAHTTLFLPAVTAGSVTAFASTAGPNDGGLVARSFDPQDGADRNIRTVMTSATDVRASMYTKLGLWIKNPQGPGGFFDGGRRTACLRLRFTSSSTA